MPDTDFLARLKVGDRVLVQGSNTTHVCTITRFTTTQVLVKHGSQEVRYRRSDGRLIGSDTWNSTWLAPATPEALDRITLKNTQATLYHILRNVKREAIEALTLEQCHAIRAMLGTYNLQGKKEE